MNNMNKMKIRLNATADVQEFVSAAEKCGFDIDIQYDSTIGDAKSILGIFSLGLAKIFTVNCHGENAEFVDAIQKCPDGQHCSYLRRHGRWNRYQGRLQWKKYRGRRGNLGGL